MHCSLRHHSALAVLLTGLGSCGWWGGDDDASDSPAAAEPAAPAAPSEPAAPAEPAAPSEPVPSPPPSFSEAATATLSLVVRDGTIFESGDDEDEDDSHYLQPLPDVGVYVDGVPVGRTGADGTLVASVPPGTREVAVYDGLITGTFVDGQTTALELITDAGGTDSTSATLILDERLPSGVVPLGTTQLTGRCRLPNRKIAPVAIVNHLDFSTSEEGYIAVFENNPVEPITHRVVIQEDGSVRTDNAAVVRAMLTQHPGRIDGSFDGRAKTVPYQKDISSFCEAKLHPFYVGRHRVSGTVMAPSSAPGLPVAGVAVHAGLVDDPDRVVSLDAVTDAAGRFVFAHVPEQGIEFAFTVPNPDDPAAPYRGSGTLDVDRDFTVRLNLHPKGNPEGVAPLEVVP